MIKPDHSAANPRASEVDAEWAGDLGAQATFHNGLPLTKPPYGHVKAIDLNRGEIAWQQPFGDWPELRANPALKGVSLPAVLGIGGPQGGVVTKGGLFFVGGEDLFLHAIDKSNGKDLWQGALPARSYGVPMTYRTRGENSTSWSRPGKEEMRLSLLFRTKAGLGTEWPDSRVGLLQAYPS